MVKNVPFYQKKNIWKTAMKDEMCLTEERRLMLLICMILFLQAEEDLYTFSNEFQFCSTLVHGLLGWVFWAGSSGLGFVMLVL